ncbi:MAG: lytic murein transglycosylase [Acidimicrobiia bacterium]
MATGAASRTIASGVLVAVLAAGCGGDDDTRAAGIASDPDRVQAAESSSSSSATSSSTTTAPPATSSSATATTATPTPDPQPKRRPEPAPLPPQPTPPPPPAGLDLSGYTVQGPASDDPAALDALARDVVTAEQALRDPATPPADMAAHALRQQGAYRAVAANPGVLPAVLDRVPAELRPVVQANVDAGADLRALVGKPRSSLPPWRIIAPPPAGDLERYYREAEARFGVPWAFLASVHLVESRMGRIRGTSTAGAQGPMQFLPDTWEAYGMGGDINDPRDAIMGAANYLKANGGAAGKMANALYRYNHSQRYVRAVTAYARQIEAYPRVYLAYYHWQVFYVTTEGDVLLPEGYVGDPAASP